MENIQNIIKKIEGAYTNIRTYQDLGYIDLKGEFGTKRTFKTLYKRPNLFYFYLEYPIPGGSLKYSVGYDGSRSYYLRKESERVQESEVGNDFGLILSSLTLFKVPSSFGVHEGVSVFALSIDFMH